MRLIFQVFSWNALAATIIPPVLFGLGVLDLDVLDLDKVKSFMIISAIAWFVFTPLWMGWEKKTQSVDI